MRQSDIMSNAMKPAAAAGTLRLGDLIVNRMAFGAMRVAGPDIWGEPKDRAAMRKLLARAFDLGHTFFDTADSYGPEVSETLIAEALHPYPSELVIGTKGGLVRPSRHRWDEDGRPEHLRRALDGSLKRLRLERIDLYQFHAPDPKVPFADSVGTLAEMQRAASRPSSRCRTSTTSRTAPMILSSPRARKRASLSSPGFRLARAARCARRR